MFSNEFHRETFVQRQPGESPNDHSDRAIRRAAEWYQAQLGDAVEVRLLAGLGLGFGFGPRPRPRSRLGFG